MRRVKFLNEVCAKIIKKNGTQSKRRDARYLLKRDQKCEYVNKIVSFLFNVKAAAKSLLSRRTMKSLLTTLTLIFRTCGIGLALKVIVNIIEKPVCCGTTYNKGNKIRHRNIVLVF